MKDGSGRVCIHYFVRDPAGPIETKTIPIMTGRGPVALGGAKGYIACNKAATSIAPQIKQGMIHPFCHTDDARAATCPECKKSGAYKTMMEEIGSLLETAQPAKET